MKGSPGDLIERGLAVPRRIVHGGRSKRELLDLLARADISLNEYARVLFESPLFTTGPEPEEGSTLELCLGDLTHERGPTLQQILDAARRAGLSPCPLEVGPYLRLALGDQEEEADPGRNRAPRGSITVLSEVLDPLDDSFPKGFYLRRMDGRLWLRGFVCSMDHPWSPRDRVVLMQGGGSPAT